MLWDGFTCQLPKQRKLRASHSRDMSGAQLTTRNETYRRDFRLLRCHLDIVD